MIFAISSAACGDDSPRDDAGADNSTADASVMSETMPGSTTAAPEPCSLVHEGKLIVTDSTDLAALENIGVVEGDLRILFDESDQRDLSFLKCIHTIDGSLDVQYNTQLESTEGSEVFGRLVR